MTTQPEPHPGALVAPTDADRIRRDVIASVYRAIQHVETAQECRETVAALGNKA